MGILHLERCLHQKLRYDAYTSPHYADKLWLRTLTECECWRLGDPFHHQISISTPHAFLAGSQAADQRCHCLEVVERPKSTRMECRYYIWYSHAMWLPWLAGSSQVSNPFKDCAGDTRRLQLEVAAKG